MSKVLITRSKLDGLATTIAAKSGATLPLTIAQMDAAVDGIVVNSDADTYAGPYEADALFSEQTFATAAKVMARDFSVHAINYTEAPNDSGVTVTIGG